MSSDKQIIKTSRPSSQRRTRRSAYAPNNEKRDARVYNFGNRGSVSKKPEEDMSPEEKRRVKRANSKKPRKSDSIKGWFSRRGKLGFVLIALLVASVLLYRPLRDYYSVSRDLEIRAQVLDQINLKNKEYSENIAHLQCEEGVKDKAHELGYVDPDEISVKIDDPNVKDSSKGDEKDSSTTISSKDLDKKEDQEEDSEPKYKLESKWYYEILDKIFFYTPPDIKGE